MTVSKYSPFHIPSKKEVQVDWRWSLAICHAGHNKILHVVGNMEHVTEDTPSKVNKDIPQLEAKQSEVHYVTCGCQ